MQKISALVFFLFSFFELFSQTDSTRYAPVRTKYRFDWGNNSTRIFLTQYGQRKDLVMIHLHDDEVASAAAAKDVLSHTGGIMLELKNKEKRLVRFKKSGRYFFFDPNRIFTSRGLEKNLRFLNGHVTSAALSSVRSFSSFILQKIPSSATYVIAVHNNEDGKYSVRSYTINGSRAKDAEKVHINPARDPDNFFIMTDTTLFRELEVEDFNVVLQSTKTARDDGSLSIYFEKTPVTYINVEAQQGRFRTQVNMLHALLRLLQ